MVGGLFLFVAARSSLHLLVYLFPSTIIKATYKKKYTVLRGDYSITYFGDGLVKGIFFSQFHLLLRFISSLTSSLSRRT